MSKFLVTFVYLILGSPGVIAFPKLVYGVGNPEVTRRSPASSTRGFRTDPIWPTTTSSTSSRYANPTEPSTTSSTTSTQTTSTESSSSLSPTTSSEITPSTSTQTYSSPSSSTDTPTTLSTSTRSSRTDSTSTLTLTTWSSSSFSSTISTSTTTSSSPPSTISQTPTTNTPHSSNSVSGSSSPLVPDAQTTSTERTLSQTPSQTTQYEKPVPSFSSSHSNPSPTQSPQTTISQTSNSQTPSSLSESRSISFQPPIPQAPNTQSPVSQPPVSQNSLAPTSSFVNQPLSSQESSTDVPSPQFQQPQPTTNEVPENLLPTTTWTSTQTTTSIMYDSSTEDHPSTPVVQPVPDTQTSNAVGGSGGSRSGTNNFYLPTPQATPSQTPSSSSAIPEPMPPLPVPSNLPSQAPETGSVSEPSELPLDSPSPDPSSVQSTGGAGTAQSSGTNEIIANVGGVPLSKIMLDTGSSALWLNQASLQGSQGFGGQKFQAQQEMQDEPFQQSYISGETVSGYYSVAEFRLGPLTIPNMRFGLATSVSQMTKTVGGIIGLNRDAATIPSAQYPTLFNQISRAQLPHRVLGFKTPTVFQQGEVTIGHINEQEFAGDLNYIKPLDITKSWTVPVQVLVDGKEVSLPEGQPSITLDSGTTGWYMPNETATQIHVALGGRPTSSDPNYQYFELPCAGIKPFIIRIQGEDYRMAAETLMSAQPSADGMCSSTILGLISWTPGTSWLGGTAFMQNVYTVFDFDKDMIGLGHPYDCR